MTSLLFLGAALPGMMAITTIPGIPGLVCNEISGTVTDAAEDGAPVSGVTVTAYARGTSSLIGSPVTSDQTGSDGTYSLEVAAGNYVLVAMSSQHTPETQVPPTVECDAAPADGQDFQMTEVASEGVPIPTIPGVGTGNLVVTVIESLDNRGSDSTRPFAGTDVAVHQVTCDNPLATTETTDENGQVEFELDEGEWCVRSSNGETTSASVMVTIEEDEIVTQEFEISKINPRTFQGRIEDFDADGANIEGVTVTAIHPFYCPGGAPPTGAEYECSAVTNSDQGSRNYRFGDSTSSTMRLPWATGSDSYQVCIEHDFYNPKCVSESVSPANPDATPPSTTDGVNEELSRAASSVSGDLGSGPRTLKFEGFFTRLTHTVNSNSNGEFIKSLPSDAYRVTILDGGSPVGYLCLALRDEDRQLGALDDVSSQLLQGRISDADHEDEPGLEDALLKFTTAKLGQSFANGANDDEECYIRTDSNGLYAIGLHEAQYSVDIVLEDWEDVQDSTITVPGAELDVGLDRETGTIEGEATDRSDGSFVEGVAITCTNVHVLEVTEYTAETDETGEFEITVPWDEHPDASDGENAWECKGEHDDFFTLVRDTYDQGTNTQPLNVGAGDDRTVNFDLEREFYYISGSVTDLNTGDPLEGASVCGKNLLEGEPTDLPETAADVICGNADENGDYMIGPFEIRFLESQEDPVILNPVAVLVTHPGYAASADVARIGSTNPQTTIDFELVPEDMADSAIVCLLDGITDPTDCVPSGVPDPEEADPENPNWVFGDVLGVNETLNCSEATSWNGWLGNTMADPMCEGP